MSSLSKPVFAKLDPAYAFDGLFVPTKGTKSRPPLKIPKRLFGDYQISFSGNEQLGANDQSVFLAICARAGIDGQTVSTENQTPLSKSLRDGLELVSIENQTPLSKSLRDQRDRQDTTFLTFSTSLTQLATDAGYSSADSRTDDVKKCLHRLRETNIRVIWPNKWDTSSKLLNSAFNHATGETRIAINPRQAKAILSGQHVRVSLVERRRLKSDEAKILHCWLCANVRLGTPLGAGNGAYVDTLIPHIWGDGQGLARDVLSNRRLLLRRALKEIHEETKSLHADTGGWHVETDGTRGNVLIRVSRPPTLPISEQ